MKIVQWIFGLMLLFFGLNGFFQFMSPPEMSATATTAFGGLISLVYLMPLMNGIFVLAAISMFTNRLVPFSLIVLAPITVNILLFHLFLDVGTILFGLIFAIFHVWLGIKHIDAYRPMFE